MRVTALDIQASLRNPMAMFEDNMTSVKMLYYYYYPGCWIPHFNAALIVHCHYEAGKFKHSHLSYPTCLIG